MEDRYVATLVLHALGDTIGFKNGEWEFNYGEKLITLSTTLELLYDFIDLGGINGIDLKGWNVSDDTIFHIATAKVLLQYNKKLDKEFYDAFKNEYARAYMSISNDSKKKIFRHEGKTTFDYIGKFTDKRDGRTEKYDVRTGGTGAVMRTPCIGLMFSGVKNRKTLIEIAVNSSRLTHNSAHGYLAGLVGSLFTAYAIENINIEKWPFMLIELLEDEDNKKLIIKDLKNIDEMRDYDDFINYWKIYIDTKFLKGKKIKSKAYKNIVFRNKYYYENFTKGTLSSIIGESGFCCVIMAYDSLLDSDGKWEKNVIYSAIHLGDSDTVGAVASAWFGAVYGFADVPENNLKHLEFKDELKQLGKKIFEKNKI